MDEEADLALLDQHLLKTNLLSQRMTSILGQLDTRLSRLDKTITPLGLQPLTRKQANIDAALMSISGPSINSIPTSSQAGPSHSRQPSQPARPPRAAPPGVSRGPSFASRVSGYSLESPGLSSSLAPIAGTPAGTAPPSAAGTPADETAILTRGPDVMALGEYFSAMDAVVADLERMYRGLMEGKGGAREAGVKDLSKLVEVGLGGSVALFLKIAREGAGRIADPEGLIASGPPSPPVYFPSLPSLLPLSNHLVQYTSPRSPHPKTQELAVPQVDSLVRGFAEIRGGWMCRILGGMVSRVEEVDEGGIWEDGRGREKVRALGSCWEVALVLVEAETLLITSLFPSAAPADLLQQTLIAPLALLSSALAPTVNTIKRSLSSHTFVALDLYQTLLRLQARWEPALSKCYSMLHTPSSSSSSGISALAPHVATLRQLSIRSFPELLVDIRSTQASASPSAGISDTTYSTLTYLETLPVYEKTVAGLLSSTQSQRSWLMGQKEAPSPAKSAEEEGGVMNLFVADVLGTLIIHLTQRSAQMRRPIGQTFLLNNLSHIRNTSSSFNSDIIGPAAEDMLNRAYRDAKSQYLSEWSALVAVLTAQQQGTRFVPNMHLNSNSERQHLKDTATQFFDRLGELESTCTQYPLSRGDPELRDRVGKEVGDLVGAGWRVFAGKCAGKGLEKYLRGSPEDVVRRVQAIFR